MELVEQIAHDLSMKLEEDIVQRINHYFELCDVSGVPHQIYASRLATILALTFARGIAMYPQTPPKIFELVENAAKDLRREAIALVAEKLGVSENSVVTMADWRLN